MVDGETFHVVGGDQLRDPDQTTFEWTNRFRPELLDETPMSETAADPLTDPATGGSDGHVVPEAVPPGTGTAELALIGGFAFVAAGRPIALPHGAERLLALVALRPEGLLRAAAVKRLWPDSPPPRAAASLRSALWQVRRAAGRRVVLADHGRLRLDGQVRVDLHELTRQARDVLLGAEPGSVWALAEELLPSWGEEWLIAEREHWNQVRLHALEAAAQRLLTRGEHLPAIEAALAAVAVEPYRESAHRLVIEVHLAEGNTACAVRHFRRLRTLLHDELGVAPSERTAQLVHVGASRPVEIHRHRSSGESAVC